MSYEEVDIGSDLADDELDEDLETALRIVRKNKQDAKGNSLNKRLLMLQMSIWNLRELLLRLKDFQK